MNECVRVSFSVWGGDSESVIRGERICEWVRECEYICVWGGGMCD